MILKLAVERGHVFQVTPENYNYWDLRSRYNDVDFYEIQLESKGEAELCMTALRQEPDMLKYLKQYKVR